MTDKKRFISVILITTAMLFACGCDKQAEPVTADPTPSHTVEPEESMERSEVTDNSEKGTDADMLSESKPVAQASFDNGSGSNSEGSTEDTGNSQTASAETTKPTEPAEPVQPAQATPSETIQPASAPEPVPAHEHTWKEHIATTQIWVPNIVVVDDYEPQTVESYLFICNCYFETDDRDVITQHVIDHADAGEASNFTIQDHSYTEQVKVGSHEEDQGHYETSTYIDYYYCDCGATK